MYKAIAHNLFNAGDQITKLAMNLEACKLTSTAKSNAAFFKPLQRQRSIWAERNAVRLFVWFGILEVSVICAEENPSGVQIYNPIVSIHPPGQVLVTSEQSSGLDSVIYNRCCNERLTGLRKRRDRWWPARVEVKRRAKSSNSNSTRH